MLPHNYRDLFSYLIWRDHFWRPIWMFATFWILPALCWFFSVCAKFVVFAIFAKIATHQGAWWFFCHFFQISHFRHFRQDRHSSRSDFCHLIWFTSPLAIFRQFSPSKFAVFAKIATLQGATFGIQFDSPALWRFFAIFAIACISGHKRAYIRSRYKTINMPPRYNTYIQDWTLIQFF